MHQDMDPGREAIEEVSARIIQCRRCPRLVSWREEVAREKRAAYADEDYWGRPVPGFGDPEPWLLTVGLAPAAHGANRTGRMFTGDRSGDFLYGALHRVGLANQPTSRRRGDGLRLDGVFVTATIRCAPPGNQPQPPERKNCRSYLEEEIDLFDSLRVIVALGGYAYDHVLRVFRDRDWPVPSPKPRFEHGGEVDVGGLQLIASYHPSQQNTFTGRLTPEMLDAVFQRAIELAAPRA